MSEIAVSNNNDTKEKARNGATTSDDGSKRGVSPPRRRDTDGGDDVYVPPKWPTPSDACPPLAMYIAGYRRSGKDEVGAGIVSGSFRHSWCVYADDRSHVHATTFARFRGARSVAFADAIRKEARRILGLRPDYDLDTRKDVECIAGKLVRDHLIEVGIRGRQRDPGMWTRIAILPSFVPRCTSTTTDPLAVVCTDWRFEIEYRTALSAGVQMVTLRVYRSNVPVPPPEVGSEHDLDSWPTTYLVVPDERDFTQARAVWPFYARYTMVGTLDHRGFTATT